MKLEISISNGFSAANGMKKSGKKKIMDISGNFPLLMDIIISGGFFAVNVEKFFLTKLVEENLTLMVISISGGFPPTNMQEHNFFFNFCLILWGNIRL